MKPIKQQIERALHRIRSIQAGLDLNTRCELGIVTRHYGHDLRFGPGIYKKQGGQTIAHIASNRVPKWWLEVIRQWQG